MKAILIGYCWVLSLFPRKVYLVEQDRLKEAQISQKNYHNYPQPKATSNSGRKDKTLKNTFLKQKIVLVKDSFDFVLSLFLFFPFFFKFKMRLQFSEKKFVSILRTFSIKQGILVLFDQKWYLLVKI